MSRDMETEKVYRIPKGLKDWPDFSGMSNFDHEIDVGFEDFLRDGGTGAYAALDLNGSVWFEDGKFHCEIWRFKEYRETISADTLSEIMELASDKYGYE